MMIAEIIPIICLDITLMKTLFGNMKKKRKEAVAKKHPNRNKERKEPER